jgi:hypothetical protein
MENQDRPLTYHPVLIRKEVDRFLLLASGLFACFVGLIVMVGWHAHWTMIAQVFPAVLPMKYNAGAAFVVLGVGLVLLNSGRAGIGAILGALIAIFMGMSLLENLMHLDFHIDNFFFNSYYQSADPFPNRVSPLTASCFVLTGAALFLTGICLHPRIRVTGIGMIACSVALVGFVAMFGYAFGIQTATGWGAYTRMSVYTAGTFIVVCAGLLSWSLRTAQRDGFNFLRWLPVTGSVTLMIMVALVGKFRAAERFGPLAPPYLSGARRGAGLFRGCL